MSGSKSPPAPSPLFPPHILYAMPSFVLPQVLFSTTLNIVEGSWCIMLLPSGLRVAVISTVVNESSTFHPHHCPDSD